MGSIVGGVYEQARSRGQGKSVQRKGKPVSADNLETEVRQVRAYPMRKNSMQPSKRKQGRTNSPVRTAA